VEYYRQFASHETTTNARSNDHATSNRRRSAGFHGDTTEGTIRFHDWIGDKWASCSRIPRTSRPCARPSSATWRKIKPEFDKRNAKIIGLSIDPVDDHKRWAKDIEETQGTAPNYPIIGDADSTSRSCTT
jgi:alkyl hydroperoxide reductase subunit AhpC